MAEAVQVSVTAAGRAERARVARAFTAGLTGPGYPCGDDGALPGSELSGSRLRHSRPGVPGDTVTVGAGEGIVRVEVTGRSRRGCRSWVPLTAMRRAVAVCRTLRAMRRGGAGGGVAGGR